MVKQTLISFKCDSDQLEKLDHVCSGLGVKRNKLLNFLVFYGNLMLEDTKLLSLMSVYERVKYFEFMSKR